jgi:hypothetical protein
MGGCQRFFCHKKQYVEKNHLQQTTSGGKMYGGGLNPIRHTILFPTNLIPVVFVADEVSAIVVDVGYTNCKAGFAGEDNPKAVFPSV